MNRINLDSLDNLTKEQKRYVISYLKDAEIEYIKTIHYLENECKKYTIRMNKLFDALRKIQTISSGEIKRIATVAIEDDIHNCMD